MRMHPYSSIGPAGAVIRGANWLSSAVRAGGAIFESSRPARQGAGRASLSGSPFAAGTRSRGQRRIAERSEGPAAAGPAIRVVLCTDLEGSTALTERVGDAEARALLRLHERIVRAALQAHGGTEVKTLGDGFLAAFFSAAQALACAVSLQQAFAAYNRRAAEPLRVRIGLNAGEPIAEEDDLFGTAVIVAARVTAEARGGEILVTDVVRLLAAGKRVRFAARGTAVLRGFEGAVSLHEVDWRAAPDDGPVGTLPRRELPAMPAMTRPGDPLAAAAVLAAGVAAQRTR